MAHAYRYLDHLTRADVAFEAIGRSVEKLIANCVDAVMHVMVSDLKSILPKETREVILRSDAPSLEKAVEDLLHELLEKVIFYKDAEILLLRVKSARMSKEEVGYLLHATLEGDVINPERHELLADVKAVTMHEFHVMHEAEVWRAQVVLDV